MATWWNRDSDCGMFAYTFHPELRSELIPRIQIIFYGRDAVLTVKFCILTADLHSKPYFTEVSLAFKKPTRSWGTHTSRLFNNVLIVKYLLAEFSEWRFFVLSEDRLQPDKSIKPKHLSKSSLLDGHLCETSRWCVVFVEAPPQPPQPPRPFGPVENYGLFHVKWPELKDTTAWFFLNVFFFLFSFYEVNYYQMRLYTFYMYKIYIQHFRTIEIYIIKTGRWLVFIIFYVFKLKSFKKKEVFFFKMSQTLRSKSTGSIWAHPCIYIYFR